MQIALPFSSLKKCTRHATFGRMEHTNIHTDKQTQKKTDEELNELSSRDPPKWEHTRAKRYPESRQRDESTRQSQENPARDARDGTNKNGRPDKARGDKCTQAFPIANKDSLNANGGPKPSQHCVGEQGGHDNTQKRNNTQQTPHNRRYTTHCKSHGIP